ncbi:hypothetical protein GF407_14890 [candidate division KSB1 bacterium]|nr:hypothetical protein [candidate division KSB1 bacterium]
MIYKLILSFVLLISSLTVSQQKMPPGVKESKNEPIVYSGKRTVDKHYFDGKLPHAVGVHQYQVVRANREHPPGEGGIGYTYNHQPYLAYWNDRFYYQYLSGLYQEHTPPTRTSISTSKDGVNWSDPTVVFPVYTLPEIKRDDIYIPEGMPAVMHQRMGFYVAPNGMLLTLGFYSYCQNPQHSPNVGKGLGRVVREIKSDGTFGPVYFIRYNRHAGFNERNTKYPFYMESDEPEFIDACDALLENKLMTLQWWEEDRADDGFYTINPGNIENAFDFHQKITTSKGAGKAFDWYTRPDGVVVGLWKNQYAALTTDKGNTWTSITKNNTLITAGSKTWAQKTDDGRYALVHNQSPTWRNRFPMVVMTSEDGYEFTEMLCVSGQVPPQRYTGLNKNFGPQYFRGISEGNGNPPGDKMWVVFSNNKEDMWIANITTPITGKVAKDIDQNFNSVVHADALDYWNLYVPQWASIDIVNDLDGINKVLQLKDEEPYDYARAERIFPKSQRIEISFRIYPYGVRLGKALEIEVHSETGERAARLRIDHDNVRFDLLDVELEGVDMKPLAWHQIKLVLDCDSQSYDFYLDEKMQRKGIDFAEPVSNVNRIVFRTGPYRNIVPLDYVDGYPDAVGMFGEDLPFSGQKVKPIIYWIDDFVTRSH